ncbi:MAG TPA: YggT family protein [Ktedonobacterales bacterium]
MQPTYPDRTPDQAPEPRTQPDDALRPTAPIRPMAYEDRPAQPAPVEPVQRAPVVTLADRAALIIWLILGVVEALLIMRVILKALAANPAAGFVQFVYNASAPLLVPFRGIFPTPASAGNVLELSALVAIVVYALIAWGIVWLLAILDPRQGQSTV